jgi:hypothetical protein
LSLKYQDRGKTEGNSSLGMGRMFLQDVVVGNSLFASLVEEAMQLWTKIWADEALYDKAIAFNMQVLRAHSKVAWCHD